MIAFLQSLNWVQIAAIVSAIGAAFFGVKDKLPALPSLGLSKPEPVDEDVADLQAMKRLEARAARSGCKKFAAAVRETEVCFFNNGTTTGV